MVCETASSGPEAIQLLRASQGEAESACRLALVDLRPPGMDGLNLATILREDRNLKSVLLVGLSPLAAAGPRQERARAVFDAILPKPPRRDALRACLLSLLGEGDMERGPGTAYPPPHPAAVPSRRARILLAEDNPVNQQLAVHLLAKMGHRVDLAGNGREAVEMAANFAYDLIFMDVQMPELDGLAATREIRSLPGPAGRIPIIAMTAHALAGDRERCLAADMDDYVSKPINPRDMAEAVQRQLSRPGPEASPPAASPARVETGVVFDLKELSARLDGDRALMAELAQIFLSSAPARLPPLEAAVMERDYRAVVFLAHGLKGELGNLSAKAATRAAGELEAAAKTGDQDRAEAAWRALREEFSRFVTAMDQAGLVRPESTGA
jgi:CheY-like chemotaxis protein/HPt (histidine-containing phosphotransfer) domain-containing protein